MNVPFAIRGIDHIVLRAREPGRLVAFYRDVLGCPVERAQPQIGLTQLRAGLCLIDVVAQGALAGAPDPKWLQSSPFLGGPVRGLGSAG